MLYVFNNKNPFKVNQIIKELFSKNSDYIHKFNQDEILSSLSLSLVKSFDSTPKNILLKIEQSKDLAKELNILIMNIKELRNNSNQFVIVIDDINLFRNLLPSSNIYEFNEVSYVELRDFINSEIQKRNIFLNKTNFNNLISLNDQYWIINELNKIELSSSNKVNIINYNDYFFFNNLFSDFISKNKRSFINKIDFYFEINEPFLIINSLINNFNLLVTNHLDSSSSELFKNRFLLTKIDLYKETWFEVLIELIRLKSTYFYSKSKDSKKLIKYKLVYLMNKI